MRNRPRIVLATPMQLPVPDVRGGAIERLMTMLIEENEKDNLLDIHVISVSDENAEKLSRSYQNSMVHYLKKPARFWEIQYSRIVHLAERLFQITLPVRRIEYYGVNRLIRRLRPDAVVGEGTGELMPMKKGIGRDKLYLHIHHEFAPDQYISKTYGNVIAVSGFIARRWQQRNVYLNQNMYIVRNAIDEGRFQKTITVQERNEIRSRLRIAESDFALIFCGRLIPEKGIEELITAIRGIGRRDIKLLVIGSAQFEGAMETDFSKKMIDEMSSDRSITHLGFIDNSLLYQYYQAADAMVIPSMWEEACGLVAIEAMYCGLPVIAARSGGLPEYLTEECALFVDRGDGFVNRLSDAVLSLVGDSERCRLMGEKSKIQASKFTRRRFYRDFAEVFLGSGLNKACEDATE